MRSLIIIEGYGGLSMKRNYTTEEKQTIVHAYLNGSSATILSREHGVPRSTIYHWVKQHHQAITEKESNSVSLQDYRDLQRKTEKLQIKLEILQSVSCTPYSPLSEKLHEIKKIADKYPAKYICETLKVSKATFYDHIMRNKGENNYYTQHREEIKQAILEAYHDHKQNFGAKTLNSVLKQRGYRTSKEMVSELMTELGLQSIRRNSKEWYDQEKRELRKKENLVKREFNPQAPNEVWVGDVTFFRFNHRNYSICTVMDLYSRKIVGFKISSTPNTRLIKSTFEQAYLARHPKSGLIFHSDQGTAYTSNTFRKYLLSLGVKQSFSQKGTPYDNSPQESFYSTLKKEELYRREYSSEKNFKESLGKYIDYYNNERPHSRLKYRSPSQYEEEMSK